MFNTLPEGTELDHGKYRIETILGQGGFGITYQAKHTRLDVDVAIKEFYPQEHARREYTTGQIVPINSPQAYQRALQRFVREGRLLQRIDHPNIVSVRDLFEERGTAYLVMQMIKGKTLRSLLDEQADQKLARSKAGVILEEIVLALQQVHEQDIYHLDLKPENILLTESGQVKLIDFGAARQGLSSETTQAFSPAYAAPEVIACQDVGPASDLFELGMVLHEMLTGRLPNSATSRLMSFATEHRDSWQPEGLDSPWRELIINALQLKADQRTQSVQQWWQGAKDYWEAEEQRRRKAEAERQTAERKRQEVAIRQEERRRSAMLQTLFKGLGWLVLSGGVVAVVAWGVSQFSRTPGGGSPVTPLSVSQSQVPLPQLVCNEPEPPALGEPILESDDGTKFYGTIKNNQIVDRGTVVYSNGVRYDGDFIEGKRSGCGRLTFPLNGSYKEYIGQFQDDQVSGLGRLVFKNNSEYIGQFKQQRCDGTGVFISSDGRRTAGTWKNGKLVRDSPKIGAPSDNQRFCTPP